jgi:hypothetical protein
MQKLRILRSNVADLGTVTVSSEVSGLPASNVKDIERTKVWRSTAGTGVATYDVDLLSSIALTSFVIANVKKVGTGVVELYDRGTSGSPVGGDGTLRGTLPTQDAESRVAFVFATFTARHIRLKFTNPTSASDYAELGRFYAGTFEAPVVNVRSGVGRRRSSGTESSSSVDGQETASRRSKFAMLDLSWHRLAPADRALLSTAWDALERATPFFLVLDADAPALAWYGRWASDFDERADLESIDRWSIALSFREAR